ncbi:MAG TPA: CrcB family protein [Jiangellaceae bacterium]|nr:CrcB family protein [Jiangellaceae bacterium]
MIALGGALGAQARYAVERVLPYDSGIPWGTLAVNAAGCLLIGVLMAALLELTAPHRLLRPLVGIGILGGFTTFSGYAVGVHMLVVDGRPGIALAYLAATPVIAIAFVWGGARFTRMVMTRRDGGGH